MLETIAIVVGGVIGLAVASEVARQNREVYILERNERFGLESSSRNSGVIHTSIFSPRGSLNAKLCIEGLNLLYGICEKHSIGYKKTGKLLVAITGADVGGLEMLYKRSDEGIDMKILSEKEMLEMEPDIAGKAAIFLPEAGVVDAYGLMCYFLGRARDAGAQLVCKSEVTGIDKIAGGYRLTLAEPGGTSTLTTRMLINCAGFYSDKVAAMAGIDTVKEDYKIYYFKGEYYSVLPGKGKAISRYLVYPVLKAGALIGIHTVLDLDGRVRLGPDFYPVDRISYYLDDSRKDIFYKATKMLFPFIEWDDIEPESAGVMPRRYACDEPFREYLIRHEQDRGLPGLINLVGIESPGLTASPAIGRYVGNLANEILKN